MSYPCSGGMGLTASRCTLEGKVRASERLPSASNEQHLLANRVAEKGLCLGWLPAAALGKTEQPR